MDRSESMASDLSKSNEDSQPTDVVEDTTLEALGYTASYRRVLKVLGSMCIVIALTSPVSAILVSGFYQVDYGGYFGLTWGWFIPSIIFFPQALATAELVSSMPINGANYWWTAALAPPHLSRPLAFVSGWTNILAVLTSIASFAFALAASLIQGASYIAPDWLPTNAQVMGIAYGLVVVWASLAFLKLEKISLIYIVCTAIILVHLITYVIALPVSHAVQHRPFAKGADVFGSFTNYSDWSAGVAVPFTWFGSLWVNSGWSAPAYVVETTHDARRSTPKAIVTSYVATAVTGMIVCLITAFCITDMDTTAADPTGFPLLGLLLSHWGSSATSAFLLIITVVTCFGGSAVVITYSFQIAAFARDGGVPFSTKLSTVNKRVNLPVHAILTLSVGGCLVLLFSLSPVAKQIIYSLAVMAILITLGLPNLLRLTAGDRYVQGPWNMGRYSKPVFAWAFLSQVYCLIMEAFPATKHFTAATFNYNWVVALGAIIVSGILYLIIGKNFVGVDLAAVDKFRHERIEGGKISTVEADGSIQGSSNKDNKTGINSVVHAD